MGKKVDQVKKKEPRDAVGGASPSRRARSAVEKIAADWKEGVPAGQIAKSHCLDIELVQWTIGQLETQGTRPILR